ncbi:dual specificity protein kinase splB-like [Uloborus diversus]|uniref:dual specificity protein kinase splB-like n=1 Tax=Uloborus diversus TaxID=327109 RepID=UPI00240A88EF|nr:dual specificity protein kinase splB-like [Uloborus diversus]
MCQQKARSYSFRNMNDIRKKLSRTLSGPRRCAKCQKMVYLSLSSCKHCGEIIHKHCSFHTNKKCCKSVIPDVPDDLECHIIGSDADDWRSRELWQHGGCGGSVSPVGSWDAEEAYRSDSAGPGMAMAGLLKIVHWLSHRKRTRESIGRACEKHYKGKYGLNIDDKETKKKFKMLIKNTKNSHYLPDYYGHYPQQQTQHYLLSSQRDAVYTHLIRQRMGPKRPSGIGTDLLSPRSSVSSYSDSSFMSPASTPEVKTARQRREKMIKQTSIKWDRDVDSHSILSANPFLTMGHKIMDQTVERPKLCAVVSPKPSLRPNETSWISSGSRNAFYGGLHQRTSFEGKNATVSFARPPCLTKAKTLSIESRDKANESLCATWPPAGKAGTILEEIVDETETDCIEEADESFNLSDFRSDSQNGEESLKEWYIPYGDIEFMERIRHGRQGDIYKGKWYGEVLIYTIRETCDRELNQFLDEVAQMGMIRHENIVLFMGACIEPQKLAVITSMRKGPTLFEYLHLKRHKLPFHSKHNIARQIAQGMGYLHAKDIVHKKLNSKNIILECRVKLCIMDHGMADKQLDRNDYGCIPRGHLSYISPELMSSLEIDPPGIYSTKPHTQSTDIFAFGSLLFELLAERFAFHDLPPHALIWQVSSGRTASLHNFRFINGLKTLIKRCWSLNPEQRPPFSEIVHILQENVSHHRRHSCSEPDRLHLTGQTSSRIL